MAPRGSSAQTMRPSVVTSTGSVSELLCTVSTASVATTSARAVSVCGAMNDTT